MSKFESDLMFLLELAHEDGEEGISTSSQRTALKRYEFIKKYGPKPLVEIEQWLADDIESYKEYGCSLMTFMEERGTSVRTENWLETNTLENSAIVAAAWVNGYTIKEEKLYVLKNKKTKRYLYEKYENRDRKVFSKYCHYADTTETRCLKCKFTQEEIDKMTDIGSYQQLPADD